MTRTRDKDNRLRYHGSAKRGRQDLRTAVIDLDQAAKAAAQARDVLKQATSSRDTQVIDRAMALAALASRFLRAAMKGRRPKARAKAPKAQLRLIP